MNVLKSGVSSKIKVLSPYSKSIYMLVMMDEERKL